MPRIDSHVHAFPDRLALKVRSTLEAGGPLTGGVLLSDVAQRVRDNGFDAAWILPYAHREGIAESVNEWSGAEVPAYPWLVPGATFHPADADLARLVRRALVELGLRVVKLHCSVGRFSAGDPRLVPIWETAAETGTPIVIHAGQQSPGDTSDDELEQLAPVLQAHPRLRVVLAHSGLPNVAKSLDLMARFDNLSCDLTPVWTRPIPVTAADIARFPGRFLFGSDTPNCPVTIPELEAHIASIGLDENARASIMGGAAAALVPGTH